MKEPNFELVKLLGRYAEAYFSKTGEELPESLTAIEAYIQSELERKVNELLGVELNILERLELEFDVVVCDCGEPYKDTDPHNIVKARLAEVREKLKGGNV